jgi:hypothetical protein
MRYSSKSLDVLIGGIVKLNHLNGERQNVLAFIQSCYCARVRSYDLEMALVALTKLTPEEEQALITWIVVNDDALARQRARSRA